MSNVHLVTILLLHQFSAHNIIINARRMREGYCISSCVFVCVSVAHCARYRVGKWSSAQKVLNTLSVLHLGAFISYVATCIM